MAGHPKKNRGHKKGKRSARNKASGKYVRQRMRTEANKARRKRASEAASTGSHTAGN